MQWVLNNNIHTSGLQQFSSTFRKKFPSWKNTVIEIMSIVNEWHVRTHLHHIGVARLWASTTTVVQADPASISVPVISFFVNSLFLYIFELWKKPFFEIRPVLRQDVIVNVKLLLFHLSAVFVVVGHYWWKEKKGICFSVSLLCDQSRTFTTPASSTSKQKYSGFGYVTSVSPLQCW